MKRWRGTRSNGTWHIIISGTMRGGVSGSMMPGLLNSPVKKEREAVPGRFQIVFEAEEGLELLQDSPDRPSVPVITEPDRKSLEYPVVFRFLFYGFQLS